MSTSLALACRLGAGSPVPSTPRRVRSILNKYGATMLLPGVSGALRFGYQPGNYRDSTGQTLAAADQQVGLVVDAAASAISVASNLNGFASVGGSPNVSLAPLAFTTTTSFLGVTIPCVVGKWYRVTAVGSTTSDAFSINTYDTSPARTEIRSGFGTCVFKADRPFIFLRHNNAGTTTLAALSVEELPGIHASQATSGFQPYLRQVPKTLGPELVVGAWGTATGVSVAGSGTDASIAFSNAGTGAASANLGAENVMQAGRKYRLTYTITNYSSGQFQFQSGGGGYASALRSANGTYSEEISPTAAATLVAKAQVSGSTFTVSNISIREVLEWTYAWQFDGTDDRLPLVSLPLASGDDFYQAFALRCTTSGANKTFADLLTNPTTGTRLGCLRINGANALQVVHANDGGGVNTVAGRTVIDGQLLVVEALRVGTSHTVFADGAVDIQTTLSGSYTTTHATIGARGAGTSEPFLGYMHGAIVCKGAPSDDERAILLKFLAKLQGRTL